MSVKRSILFSTIAAAALLGFAAAPAVAQIPLQPAAPAPVASSPQLSTGSDANGFLNAILDNLLSGSGGGVCNPNAGVIKGCG
ncbi:hypothetical protein KO481_05985 [Nocardia sp. NEAU-G5]|uniref:DUF320 domain-containing protein n=1 Tax=Nocardia albiluteola TaxID=2842303 RepID=A0ABS6ASQ7_9NOCA|nr:hypothetical protein [Nocardia albiluteola]MBU3061069.1 hypothetical protein [Nocardia albiluteola]